MNGFRMVAMLYVISFEHNNAMKNKLRREKKISIENYIKYISLEK